MGAILDGCVVIIYIYIIYHEPQVDGGEGEGFMWGWFIELSVKSLEEGGDRGFEFDLIKLFIKSSLVRK